jgi:Flp pilus assembly protein TadG
MSSMVSEQFTDKRAPSQPQRRRRIAPKLRNDSGQALIEFALVLPVLLVLIIGIFKFGVTFTNYLTLTDAARNGARQLAVDRGQATPCVDATNAANSAAGGLGGITVTESFPAPDTSTCASLVAGDEGVVTATYPCDLSIMGIDFAPGCTLSSTATERIE